ncbi:lytic murein transglycosylase [bacterium]|nr:lytic murein transglycosylase [bacterium]
MVFGFPKKPLAIISLVIIFSTIIFIKPAQSSDINLSEFCPSFAKNIDQECSKLGYTACHQALKNCEKYYQQKNSEYQTEINSLTKKEKNLKNQIYYLSTKIKNLNYQIYNSNIVIKDLSLQIKNAQSSIDNTNKEIDKTKRELTNILRLRYEEDKKSPIEIFLSEDSLSGFFNDLMALQSLNLKTKDLLANILDLKTNLENQKESMSNEKENLESIVLERTLQMKESQSLKQEQEYILKTTKGREALYQEYLKEIEEKSAKIRAKLFELAGDVKAPTFSEAIELANLVSTQVKIRPAFLLAVLSQESRIGQNVGKCYVTNRKTGGGIYSNGNPAPRIMNPTRDLPIFLSLMSKLGYSFSKKPVSCWIKNYYKGKPYGWGGAMGPAQFIPSTWKLYEDKIKSYTGKSVADPWDIKDSFLAAALYLHDLGAKTTQGEFRAASRYYGGSVAYAKEVSTRAWCIQQFIERGIMSQNCQKLIF